MVNRKITLGLLALVGGLTIVGSGFSAWYFGDNNLNATSNVDAHVTLLAEGFGKITVENLGHVNLQLDQGGYANKEALDKGISFINADLSKRNEAITATYEIESGDSLNAMNAGLKATFDCTVTLKKEFANYIKFKDTFYTGNSTIGVDTSNNATFKVSKEITFTANKVTEEISFNISTSDDLVNSAFEYKPGMKPQDKIAFEALYALNDTAAKVYQNALTFSYSLNVTAK